MPRYRFKCDDCGEEFIETCPFVLLEILVPHCESCGSENATRMVSQGISTHYNGDGYTKAAKKTKTKDTVKIKEEKASDGKD